MYFAAAITIYHNEGGGAFHGGGGISLQGGLTLALTWLMASSWGGTHGGVS